MRMSDMGNLFGQVNMTPAHPEMIKWVENKINVELIPEFLERLRKKGECDYSMKCNQSSESSLDVVLYFTSGMPCEAYRVMIDAESVEWMQVRVGR